MKVTAYNHHARLLSPELVGRLQQPVYSGWREPTLSCNQLADNPPTTIQRMSRIGFGDTVRIRATVETERLGWVNGMVTRCVAE
jgi:hypothetical protein